MPVEEALEVQEEKVSVVFRLLKLQPSQIPDAWDWIREAIKMSSIGLIEVTEEQLSSIQQALLACRLTAWVFYKQRSDEDKGKIVGLMTTTVVEDTITQTKHLLICNLAGFNNITNKRWKSSFKTLAKYARSKECSVIRGVTLNERLLDIVNQLSGKVVGYAVEMEV